MYIVGPRRGPPHAHSPIAHCQAGPALPSRKNEDVDCDGDWADIEANADGHAAWDGQDGDG